MHTSASKAVPKAKPRTCLSRQQRGLRKNTESNLSNQAFSYLACQDKSSKVLANILEYNHEPDKRAELFYTYMSVLSSGRRRYISKKTLSELSTMTGCRSLQQLSAHPVYSDRLPISEFCRYVRTLLRYFMRNICQRSILTSKKLSKGSVLDHFKRRRQMMLYMDEQVSEGRHYREI